MAIIYFYGGAKGVGKSSLLREASKITEIPVVNTGDFFNNASRMNVEDPLNYAKDEMITFVSENKNPVILDTHYAGFVDGIYSGKFERGLYSDELHRVATASDLELFLVDLDSDLLMERRQCDSAPRDLIYSNIKKELEMNRFYFEQYCQELQKSGIVIRNYDFEKSLNEILDSFL